MQDIPGIGAKRPGSTLFAGKGALPVPSTSHCRILQYLTWTLAPACVQKAKPFVHGFYGPHALGEFMAKSPAYSRCRVTKVDLQGSRQAYACYLQCDVTGS